MHSTLTVILNLGCGTKTSPRVTNVDWSMYLRLRKNRLGRAVARSTLRGERRLRFDAIPDTIVVHDLRKGIPVSAASADAVYHSHMLEHIDRAAVQGFLEEIRRVLKPGGIQRIVVPDLELHVRDYLADLEAAGANHDELVAPIIEQAVRREAVGTSRRSPLHRWLESVLLGDARKRGETHQWMWDRLNLSQALESAGFVEVTHVDAHTSQIPNWNDIGLDLNPDGSVYKPGSLFMEARKPQGSG